MAPEGESIIVLDLELLRHLSQLKDLNPRLAIDSFVATLGVSINRNGCELAVKEDTLRKLVSQAFLMFTLSDVKALQPSNHGVEECDHISQECPACQGSQ